MRVEKEQPRPANGNEVVAKVSRLGSRHQTNRSTRPATTSLATVVDLAEWKARKAGPQEAGATPSDPGADTADRLSGAAQAIADTVAATAADRRPYRAQWRVTWRFTGYSSRRRSFRSQAAAVRFMQRSLTGYGNNLAWCMVGYRSFNSNDWVTVYRSDQP